MPNGSKSDLLENKSHTPSHPFLKQKDASKMHHFIAFLVILQVVQYVWEKNISIAAQLTERCNHTNKEGSQNAKPQISFGNSLDIFYHAVFTKNISIH